MYVIYKHALLAPRLLTKWLPHLPLHAPPGGQVQRDQRGVQTPQGAGCTASVFGYRVSSQLAAFMVWLSPTDTGSRSAHVARLAGHAAC